MIIESKVLFTGLGFGVATLIFGMILFKIFRIVNADFNNDIIIGILLLVSGSLSYIAYNFISTSKITGTSKKVKFNDNVEVVSSPISTQ